MGPCQKAAPGATVTSLKNKPPRTPRPGTRTGTRRINLKPERFLQLAVSLLTALSLRGDFDFIMGNRRFVDPHLPRGPQYPQNRNRPSVLCCVLSPGLGANGGHTRHTR